MLHRELSAGVSYFLTPRTFLVFWHLNSLLVHLVASVLFDYDFDLFLIYVPDVNPADGIIARGCTFGARRVARTLS